MVAQARVVEQTLISVDYPSDPIIKLPVGTGVAITPVPDHVRQLDMRDSAPILIEGVISKHLTHLAVRTLTENTIIPETLEHLFVSRYDLSVCESRPNAKNLYFHADYACSKDLIPFEHYVFYWSSCTIPKRLLEGHKYDLTEKTPLEAFGTIVCVIKRTPKIQAAPEPYLVPTITPKPALEILTAEKMEAFALVNAEAIEALYSPEVTYIVSQVTNGVEAAAKAGKLAFYSFTYVAVGSIASNDIAEIIRKYLPTMIVRAVDSTTEIRVSI